MLIPETSSPVAELTLDANPAASPPWISKAIRRLIRNRKREFRRHGRSKKWREKSAECHRRICESKAAYLEKLKNEIRAGGTTRKFYQTVKVIDGDDTTQPWNIRQMFPADTPEVIAEKAANFFNTISQEFEPLPLPTNTEGICGNAPEMHEISAMIKKMKKTKSTVNGDIDYRLVTKYRDFIAIPLHYIFKQIYAQLQWPCLLYTSPSPRDS